MSQELRIKDVERRAWLSLFDDGLIDLFLGSLLLWHRDVAFGKEKREH